MVQNDFKEVPNYSQMVPNDSQIVSKVLKWSQMVHKWQGYKVSKQTFFENIQTQYRPILLKNTDLLQTQLLKNTDPFSLFAFFFFTTHILIICFMPTVQPPSTSPLAPLIKDKTEIQFVQLYLLTTYSGIHFIVTSSIFVKIQTLFQCY